MLLTVHTGRPEAVDVARAVVKRLLTAGIGVRLLDEEATAVDIDGTESCPATTHAADGCEINLVIGGDGSDVISGGVGDDRLTGADGADTFVFTGGQDVITDFEDGADVIRLVGIAGIDDFADLSGRISAAGDDVVIDLGAPDELTLAGTALGEIDAADFLFG